MAMTMASSQLGDALLRLPDGEPGPRRGWVFYQRPMFTHHQLLTPDLSTGGTPDVMSRRRVKEGVAAEDIEFPELGYAREASTSYRWFEQAKADGRVREDVRFQVSLPTPWGICMAALYPDAMEMVEPAYEAAMLREVEAITAAIPHDQLAMQWDVCLEMLLYDGRAFPFEWDDAAFRDRFARITAAIPADVHMGMHLCYGDYDGKHTVEPIDGTKLTEMANLVTEATTHPLRWLHMPVPIERDDDAYFAPFDELALNGETEVFLGLVHHADGVEGAQRRMAAALPHVPAFGVATECGIGRVHDTAEIETIFDIHAALTS
ncbi:MAG: hypothetical protein EX269_05790 [Acidimicrobiales bacterium]|nr:MAG: hypothetical protein EX269_05790 [Acidimicrobiales bacterium]